MDFSEILRNITRSLDRLGDAIGSFVRSNRKTALGIIALIFVVLIVWARLGFTFELSRFFASEPQVQNPDNTDTGGTGGTGTGTSPTPTPSQAASGSKHSPWRYFDYATKTCLDSGTILQIARDAVGGQDYDDARCGGPGVAGQCRIWAGTDANSWKPADGAMAACEPLSEITEQSFPGFATPFYREGGGVVPGNINPSMPKPPPINFPDCFYLESGYSSGDPNFGTMTEHTVPEILQNKPNAKLEYKAFLVNNCPWDVHLVWQIAASKKASQTVGLGGRNLEIPSSEYDKLFTENTAPGRDFPSCWNKGGADRPANCAKFISIGINLNTYTCGSVGLQLAWWQRPGGGESHVDDRRDGMGLVSVLNYGKDCTGSAGERAPGSLGTTGTTGGTCAAPTVRLSPAVISGQCGATQNVINWRNPITPTFTRNSLFRNTYDAAGKNLASVVVFTEQGCWNGTGNGTFTDKNLPVVPGGAVTRYVMKTYGSPNAWSQNDLACPIGLVASASPSPSRSPGVSVSPTPTPSVIVVSTPTPVTQSNCGLDGPTGDLDCDGIPNNAECPGYLNTANLAACPDSDNDGSQNPVDTDSDNDGVPDSQDTNLAGVGTVQTGPGEATLLAFIVSAVVSLLYVSYTYSPAAKRREAEAVAEDQGSMDFRN